MLREKVKTAKMTEMLFNRDSEKKATRIHKYMVCFLNIPVE